MSNKYILSIVFLFSSINLFGAWDQSLERWSIDCKYEMATACSIVAGMYEKGIVVVFDGVNHEKKVKKQPKKALKYYDKACKLGDKFACRKYNKLSKKINIKYGIRPHKLTVKNTKNYSIKNINSKTIYTILGKKSCKIIIKNKKITQNSCKKIKNSKGILIYCTKDIKVCKTKKEILNSFAETK